MTPTKEKLYELNELDIQQARTEYLIQELMPIISSLPISKEFKKMAERYLSRPEGHSLLASDISQRLIDMTLMCLRDDKPDAETLADMFVDRYQRGIRETAMDINFMRFSTIYYPHSEMYRKLLLEKIRETAMDNICRQLENLWKKNGNRTSMPAGWYALFAIHDRHLISSQWWETRLHELSKFGFTKDTARNIIFYLIVVMACRWIGA